MSSAGAKRKKTHIPSDFKRIKAKVGKRAPKAANFTDTSFKAASLNVRGQTIATDPTSGDAADITSGRGHTFQELANQLNHPAGQARISALKGIQDAVRLTSREILQSHLSSLLPTISKCACVDQEDDVRELGLTCLNDLLLKIDNQHIFKPYSTLLLAFVTSALNSLDRSTRLDGARAIQILTNLMTIERETVANILPGYVPLMRDHAHFVSKQRSQQQQQQGESSQKKKKKKQSSTQLRRLVIPTSLVALLRSIDTTHDHNKFIHRNSPGPDMTCLPGGRSANALLIADQEQRSTVSPLSSLDDLAKRCREVEEEKGSRSDPSTLELISKLRDAYVEVTQRGNQLSGGGLSLALPDMEEIAILVTAIHLLCKAFAVGDRSTPKQALSIILEAFPVLPRSQDQASRYETLNSNICFAIMDIGSSILEPSVWVNPTLQYTLPRMTPNEDQSRAFTCMNVLSGLLLLRNGEDKFVLETSRRHAILDKICSLYFDSGCGRNLRRSSAGRKAVQLVSELLRQNQYNADSSVFFQQMLESLPEYTYDWANDFVDESTMAIDTMHSVFRRVDSATLKDSKPPKMITTIRAGLASLFDSGKKQSPPSIFAGCPVPLQRQLLSLLVILGAPTEDTLKSLSKACARAGDGTTISQAEADFIVECMFLVRKSFPIQVFLRFVLNGIGLPKSGKKIDGGDDGAAFSSFLNRHDRATLRATRVLRRCGIEKVVPLILPSLLSWISFEGEQSAALVRFRSALQIMAAAALELESEGSDLLKVCDRLIAPLLDSILMFFCRCSWKGDKSDLFGAMSKSLVALLASTPTFFERLVQKCSVAICDDASIEAGKSGSVLDCLSAMIGNKKLESSIRSGGRVWALAAARIQKHLSGTTLDAQAQSLAMSVKLLGLDEKLEQSDKRVAE